MTGNGIQGLLRFSLTFVKHTPTGPVSHTDSLEMPLFMAWEVADAIQRLGVRQAASFAAFAVAVAHMAPGAGNPLPTVEQQAQIEEAIQKLTHMFSRQWETLEDRVLDFTYQWMRHKAMTRETAALFASSKLGYISTDAWRKKVDRWAKSNGYPALGQTKRRPRKS